MRFVIQEHKTPSTPSSLENVHYDFMLEQGETLKTWRFPFPPDIIPQTVEQIQDHRKLYLEYEGEISGNRGSVKIWDQGDYSAISHPLDGILQITLHGKKLLGTFYFEKQGELLWRFGSSLTA